MAVLLRIHFGHATQAEFNELDDRVGEAMDRAGGPPAGLLAHVVYPDADGFVLADVWRSEAEGRDFLDQALRPVAGELGLSPGEAEALPVWSFARP